MKLNDIAQRRPAHPPINPLTGLPNAPEAVSGTAAPGSAGAAASDSPKATVPPAAAPNLHNKERDPAHMGTDGERSSSSEQEPASTRFGMGLRSGGCPGMGIRFGFGGATSRFRRHR